MTTKNFNFSIQDLQYFVVRRTDGTIIKTTLVDDIATAAHATTSYKPYTAQYSKLSDYCVHEPKVERPIFDNGPVRLYVADVAGARKTWGNFDYVMDCGNDINPFPPKPVLSWDGDLCAELEQYSERINLLPATRLLKVDWADRQAPDLHPQFWPDFVAMTKPVEPLGITIMTCCIGGHGRSGSAATILMMMLTDYTPKEAIIHLRANHCPRAIESIVQHDYLNRMGAFLGRPENAHDAESIVDYKKAFEEMKTSGRAQGVPAAVPALVVPLALSAWPTALPTTSLSAVM